MITTIRHLRTLGGGFIRITSTKRGSSICTTDHHNRWLSISRMLDMGGAPSAANDSSFIRTVNASKNSKLQAVAFDFDLLTQSFDKEQGISSTSSTATTATTNDTNSSSRSKNDTQVQPDLDQIRNVASLLNVEIDTTTTDDDNSRDGIQQTQEQQQQRKTKTPTELPKFSAPGEDIRAKYARKLAGGLAGIELAKSQVENTLARGDAGGHMFARKRVQEMANPTTSSSSKGSRWMAMTGSGKLLSYLTHRSIKIALLPDPTKNGDDHQSMQDLSKQLPEVVVDVIIDGEDADRQSQQDTGHTAPEILTNQLMKELDVDPNLILVVSNNDNYLKSARDLGMITCKLQQKNSRRGNITVHYTPETLQQVQEVVNEINGISFNAVLNR